MAEESDALKLLRQEQAANRDRFAQRETAAQRLQLQRQPSYRYVGKDANTGQAVVQSAPGGIVPVGDIHSNGLMQPDQSVRVLVAPGKVTVKHLPRRVRQTKAVQLAKDVASIKWLAIIRNGNALEFYLCGTQAKPKKVYVWEEYQTALGLSQSLPLEFNRSYRTLNLSPFTYLFDGVFNNLGVGEDAWLYTFGLSKSVSYDDSGGGLVSNRQNYFYQLTSKGLVIFAQDTAIDTVTPFNQFERSEVHYYNAGHGYFYRQSAENTYTLVADQFGAFYPKYAQTNVYAYVTAPPAPTSVSEVASEYLFSPVNGLGAEDNSVGAIKLPKLDQSFEFEFHLKTGYFANEANLEANSFVGREFYPLFSLNRQGTAALGFGRYGTPSAFLTGTFSYSAAGVSQSPTEAFAYYPQPFGGGTNNYVDAEVKNLVKYESSVLASSIARFVDLNWRVIPHSNGLAKREDSVMFGEFAARKFATLELYSFRWQKKRTVKVAYYQHKSFALPLNSATHRLINISNASYYEL